MAIADRDTVGSQFVITFKANHDLDRKYIVFGQLVQGNEVLKKIENVGDEEGIPTVTVKIINCGEVIEDKRKNKLRMGKDASSGANNYEVRRKGKNKKSSRDKRKKRRRHYSSDSDSSSDSEIESSESDSDSDSYLSSSSDISSSSDDGHKKRKRYFKRGKYRRGKKRERRRDKKRKRRDKRSKRKSRRASDSLTDDDSESSSESSSDNDDQGKPQKHEGPSQKSVGLSTICSWEPIPFCYRESNSSQKD
ncbi:hypothetical protein Gohar_014661 [Gossypium harknessii]|uniref:PPIase cyclophilin-type domain-containing protein n=1 Tax=Gossypium harknessii TaxID=34285 RepID=A0A7J9FXF8_9ROSI|nr:hypothetical protein [Gossypium harknessii]